MNELVRVLGGKKALEVGGPTDDKFLERIPIYPVLERVDCVRFAINTTWEHSPDFLYCGGTRSGNLIIAEMLNLSNIVLTQYDAILSGDTLEHCANPIKALKEMSKVLVPGGYMLHFLPFYKGTFDHFRSPTPFNHLVEDYTNDVDESDLTHLTEILALHDLELDPPAGNFETFRHRSQRNIENRCLHHHVFDENNVRSIMNFLKLEVLKLETASEVMVLVRKPI